MQATLRCGPRRVGRLVAAGDDDSPRAALDSPSQTACPYFLPTAAPAGLPLGNAEQAVKASFTVYRILLVEDEPINLAIALMLFAETGLEVDAAEGGDTAVEMPA